MPKDAVVIITADVRDKQLVLTVSDNGKGADQAMLGLPFYHQKKKLKTQKNAVAHIGIQSVLKRIHILYGTDYGMTMEKRTGQRYDV